MTKILVVEDHPSIRYLFRMSLEKRGFAVVEAADGKTALSIFSDTNNIDVIVTDLSMPIMTGAELIEAVRTQCRPVKIIVVSAYVKDENERKAVAQADATLLKPIPVTLLVDTIRSVLRNTT